jgi:deoxyribonuclease-4
MQWFGKPYETPAVALYKEQLKQSALRHVFGHTGYLINLAANPSANREKSLASLVQEIELATQLGLPFLVLHPGAHLTASERVGLQNVARALDEVFEATRESRVRIALENTAGQGSCLGCRIEQLAWVYQHVKRPERLGLCLDTAHFFAAGYDIRSPGGWDHAIAEVSSKVGLKEILAFHLNDSKTDLGSRVDRHEHIGKGKIGLEAFRSIVNDARFRHHPGCLETPKGEDLKEDVENLRVLRSLVETQTRAKERTRKAARILPRKGQKVRTTIK